MIYFITARPGVGKSLHCVHLLEELKKDKTKNYHFIGNLEGYDFDEVLPHGSSPEIKKQLIQYVTETDWETKCKQLSEIEDKKLIITFDECQSFLRKGTLQRDYKEKLLYFFEIARHYGADIYLISQSWNKLDSEIQDLVHQVHKVSMAKLPNTNRVRVYNPEEWEIIETIEYGNVDQLYGLYKTAHTEDGNQQPKTSLGRTFKIIGISLIGLAIIISFAIYKTTQFFDDNNLNVKNKTPVKIPSTKEFQNLKDNKKLQTTDLDRAVSRLRKQWQHPIYPEKYNGVTCYKSTSYTWTCPDIKKTSFNNRIFTSSICKNNFCDYSYFDIDKYIADGKDEYCCLPDGSSLSDNNKTASINKQPQQLTLTE